MMRERGDPARPRHTQSAPGLTPPEGDLGTAGTVLWRTAGEAETRPAGEATARPAGRTDGSGLRNLPPKARGVPAPHQGPCPSGLGFGNHREQYTQSHERTSRKGKPTVRGLTRGLGREAGAKTRGRKAPGSSARDPLAALEAPAKRASEVCCPRGEAARVRELERVRTGKREAETLCTRYQ